MTSTQTSQVKMFASFNRGIFIPIVAPNDSFKAIHERIKEKGGRISPENVRRLLEGQEAMINDFEVVTVVDHHRPMPAAAPVAAKTAPVQAPAPVVAKRPVGRPPLNRPAVPPQNPQFYRRANDQKPATAPVQARTAPAPQPLPSPAVHTSRGRGRNYAPQGELKPIKRNTLYARVMEMLLNGATMDDLMSLVPHHRTTGGINDILGYTIKEAGYGLAFDENTTKMYLVFPEGVNEIVYKN